MDEIVMIPRKEGVPHVTADRWIEAVLEVLRERGPKYKYERPDGGPCKYFHQGEPSCLFGAVFESLGVPRAYVEEEEAIDALMRRLWNQVPLSLAVASSEVQYLQDTGSEYFEVEECFLNMLSPL